MKAVSFSRELMGRPFFMVLEGNGAAAGLYGFDSTIVPMKVQQ
jgi:hypothetical protein